MTGKEFLERMEAAFPGFLGRLYPPPYSRERDQQIADALLPVAWACGLEDLTGAMVGKARQSLRLVAVDRTAHSGPRAFVVDAPEQPRLDARGLEPGPQIAVDPGTTADALDRLARGLHAHLDRVRVRDTLHEEVEEIGRRVQQLERKSGVADLIEFPPQEAHNAS